MPEIPTIRFSESLPEFDALRNDLKIFRDLHTNNDTITVRDFTLGLLDIVNKNGIGSMPKETRSTLDKAMEVANAGIVQSSLEKKNLAWATVSNLVDTMESKAIASADLRE